MALKELNHDDLLNPPKEVLDHAENAGEELHRFKAHAGDYYVLPKETEAEGKTD